MLAHMTGCGGGGEQSFATAPPAVHNQWAWMGGSQAMDQPGNYGTQGVPSTANVPGARFWACSWTDTSGNFWLFGGYGWGSPAKEGDWGDLWEYSNGQWAWVDGPDQPVGTDYPSQPGIYGTMGVPAPGNQPGARDSATCWTDPQGNIWLYGGEGFDSTGTAGQLEDLWRYNNGEWAWMNGSDIATQETNGSYQGMAVYGTQGVAAPSNTPGPRRWASGWADPSGNLWLFGGAGEICCLNGNYALGGDLNDLWIYTPSTGEWTWMAGSNQIARYGTYGTLGTSAPGNTPGSRTGAAAWSDAAGNLWLFGGSGVGIVGDDCGGGMVCILNDLWKFNPSLNEWTWVAGPNISDQPGVYGTEGMAAPGNLPPPRENAVTLADSEGNVWLFGGDVLAGGSTMTSGNTATANGRG